MSTLAETPWNLVPKRPSHLDIDDAFSQTTTNVKLASSRPSSPIPQTMKTRVAILDKSPHRFQVIPLQQARQQGRIHSRSIFAQGVSKSRIQVAQEQASMSSGVQEMSEGSVERAQPLLLEPSPVFVNSEECLLTFTSEQIQPLNIAKRQSLIAPSEIVLTASNTSTSFHFFKPPEAPITKAGNTILSEKDVNIPNDYALKPYHERAQSADPGRCETKPYQHRVSASTFCSSKTIATAPAITTPKTVDTAASSYPSTPKMAMNKSNVPPLPDPHIKSPSLGAAMPSPSPTALPSSATPRAGKRSPSTIPRLTNHRPATHSLDFLHGGHSTARGVSRSRSHASKPCRSAFQPLEPLREPQFDTHRENTTLERTKNQDQAGVNTNTDDVSAEVTPESPQRALSKSKRHAIYTHSLTLNAGGLELSFNGRPAASRSNSSRDSSPKLKRLTPKRPKRETLPISFTTRSSLPYAKNDSTDSVSKMPGNENAEPKQQSQSVPDSHSSSNLSVLLAKADDLGTTVSSFLERHDQDSNGDQTQSESTSSTSISSLYSQDSFSSMSPTKNPKSKASRSGRKKGSTKKKELVVFADGQELQKHPIIVELLNLLDASVQEWMTMEIKVGKL
ncbi:hypothetical protein VKT23_005191 [Stygiomarasmius scandens]|uniref:Uncharacterized protein n=1 Tax=Marasmiellus scandens TaxID=2682957 RepID=A0ABR1JYA5_9AGAR